MPSSWTDHEVIDNIPSMVKSREHRNHCRVWLHYCYTVCCFFVYADIQWSAQGGKCWWSQHRGLSLCNKQIPWLFHVRKLQCSLSHTYIYYVYSTIRNDHRSCCFSIWFEWTDLHSCYVWSWSSHAVKVICSWLSAEHLASEYKELKGVRVITLFHQFSIFLPGYTIHWLYMYIIFKECGHIYFILRYGLQLYFELHFNEQSLPWQQVLLPLLLKHVEETLEAH